MEHAVIFFDDICNLCCGWVRFLVCVDRKEIFQFASLKSETAKELNLNIKLNSIETIVYQKNHKQFIESDAIFEILRDLGGFWKLFLIFKKIPKSNRDNIYRFIARNRFKVFGKKSICMIIDAKISKRFIE